MIAAWMLYSLATGLLLFAGTVASDYVARERNRSTRMLWFAAMIVFVVLSARALAIGMQVPSTSDSAVSISRGMPGSASSAQAVARKNVPANVPAPRFYQRLPTALDGVASGRLASFDRPLEVMAVAATMAALAYLCLSFMRLRRIERRLEPRELDGQRVLISRALGPALLGVIRPRIVIPEWIQDLPPAHRRVILAHEQRHAVARDPLLSLANTVLVALQPWNPVLWAMRSRLRLAIEIDCDRRVVRATGDVRGYAELLLTVHERTMSRPEPMLAFVERPSNLEWRVRQMTRRPMSALSPRAVLTTVAAALLVIAACTTPEPTANKSSTAPSSASLSSITGGGRCLAMARDEPRKTFEEMRALATTRHRDIADAGDSTDVIGFVLDENCNVRRDTVVKMPPGPKNGDAMVHAAFPGIKRDSTWHGGVTFLYRTGSATRTTRGPSVVFLVEPSESWRARRASDRCGFGARADEFCSIMGSVAMLRVDSTHLVIAVRSRGNPTAAPYDHFFLVSSLRPLPDSLTRRIRFARVMFQHNAVYVENRVTTDPAMVFGWKYASGFKDFQMPRDTFDSLVGIAHYASPGVTLDNIDQLRPARKCDGPIGSCYEVAGKTIEFP